MCLLGVSKICMEDRLARDTKIERESECGGGGGGLRD